MEEGFVIGLNIKKQVLLVNLANYFYNKYNLKYIC